MSPRTWYVSKTGNHQGLVIEEGTGKNIAVTYDSADAPLVAAAPDLLTALEMAASFIENGESSGYTFFEVREAWRYALEKAETS